MPNQEHLQLLVDVLQLDESQSRSLFNAQDGVVAESLALHEILSLYLDQTDLTDAQILGRLGNRVPNKLRDWRRRAAIPTNAELAIIIQTFELNDERASKLRSAKPRLSYSAEALAFILLGSGKIVEAQVDELVEKGVEIASD